MFSLEKHMRESVTGWMESRGFLCAVEFSIWHMVDIVAGRFGERTGRAVPPLLETVAIELKLSDVSGVIYQARGNLGQVDWSYAAMPSERCARMRLATRAKFLMANVGLLSVGQTVAVVIPAQRGDGPKGRVVENLWRRVRKQYRAAEHSTEKTGVGGSIPPLSRMQL